MGTTKIVVIGNGFDLHHKLKTGYSDFFNSTYCSDSLKAGMYKILNFLENKKGDRKNVDLWSDVEKAYFMAMMLIDVENGDITKVKEFNSTIEKFKIEFMEYLDKSLIYNQIEKDNKLQVVLDGADIILDFNYTDTVERIYSKYSGTKHIKVHGSLKEKKIVLGFANTYSRDNKYLYEFIKKLDNSTNNTSFIRSQDIFDATLYSYCAESIEKWEGEKIWQRILLDFYRFAPKDTIKEDDIKALNKWYNDLESNQRLSEDFVKTVGIKTINALHSPRTKYQGDKGGGEVPAGYQCIFKDRYTSCFEEDNIPESSSKLVDEFLRERKGMPGLIDLGKIFCNNLEITIIGHSLESDIDFFRQLYLLSSDQQKKVSKLTVYMHEKEKGELLTRAKSIFECEDIIEQKY